MKTTPVIISLGSNLGDRRWYLREAIRRLGRAVHIARVSSVYETEPMDTPAGSAAFLNVVVLALATQTPLALLDVMKRIERDLGRRPGSRNQPRVIDLDLILFGSLILNTPKLTIPHPRYRTRNFVLAPLGELGLSWIDPVQGTPISSFHGKGRVRRLY